MPGRRRVTPSTVSRLLALPTQVFELIIRHMLGVFTPRLNSRIPDWYNLQLPTYRTYFAGGGWWSGQELDANTLALNQHYV